MQEAAAVPLHAVREMQQAPLAPLALVRYFAVSGAMGHHHFSV